MKSKIMELDNYDFEVGDEFSDIKLIVENKTLHVHKAILTTASPVFKKMFTYNFKESKENQVHLPDKKYDDILQLLKYLYPNFNKEIDESKAEILLELSEEYTILNLKKSVENIFIKNLQADTKSKTKKFYGNKINEQLEYAINLINLSTRYRLNKLLAECVNYISEKFDKSQLEKSTEFKTLDLSIKLDVLNKKIDTLEEKLKTKDTKLKQMQDELLKQKFEIQHLKNLTTNEMN